MRGSVYRRNCTCGGKGKKEKKKKCTCGAKYAFTVDIGPDPVTGERRQKQRSGFQTQEEAHDAANELLYEVRHGTYIEESKIFFKDFAPQWLAMYSQEREVKPGTLRVRQHEIDKLMPYFAHVKLKNITTEMYKQALYALKKSYAGNTVDGIHRTGRMIFKKAIEKDLIRKDPTAFTILRKEKKTIEELKEPKIPKYLEKEELALFLDTAEKKGLEMDYLIFLVLAYTGMRVGELVSLQWSDIDFRKNSFRIIKTYYNPNNNTMQYELGTPKTMGSVRTIVVEDIVIEALKEHKLAQEKVKKRFGTSYYDEDFIFAKTERHPGYPVFIKTIQNRMNRLLKMAGLNEKLTPHSLRHTHTSLLAEAGVVLEDIMERLGHTDDYTTKIIYRHVTEKMKKEASQKFGQLMRSL